MKWIGAVGIPAIAISVACIFNPSATIGFIFLVLIAFIVAMTD